MRKLLPLLFFTLTMAFSFAQTQERVLIIGLIAASQESDIEGVTIYNSMTNKGVVTNAKGEFELLMGINDAIKISAVQYKTFTVVVDEKTIETKKLGMFLNPVVNELNEVMISKNNLTGNFEVDVEKIKTVILNTKGWGLTLDMINYGQDLNPDDQSSFKDSYAIDAYNNSQQQNGINLKGFAWLAKKIFKKKKNAPSDTDGIAQEALLSNLLQRFSPQEIRDAFNIAQGNEADFLLFVAEIGMEKDLLEEANELLLYALMMEKAKQYRQSIDE